MRRILACGGVSLLGFLILNCDTTTAPPGNITGGLDGSIGIDGGQQTTTEDSGPSQQVFACAAKEDCGVLKTTPENCAEPIDCIGGQCVYVAVDSDGDTHRMAGCVDPNGKTFDGDDCSDKDPKVFPGASCTQDASGNPIVFPGGTPQGTCKAGAIQCVAGAAKCMGAVAPQAKDDCATNPGDEDCDGVVNNGCPCPTLNATQPCGSAVGNCKQGVQTCTASGWSACVGGVTPQARNCGGKPTEDYDCNKQEDISEAECLCGGKSPIGSATKCSTGLLGVCAAGTQSCGVDPKDSSFAAWSACVQSKAAGPIDCNSTADYDCDGISDELEASCPGNPCGKFIISPKSGLLVKVAAAAKQKFTATMWGCEGSVTWDKRNDACGGNGTTFTACSSTEWANYAAAGGKIPTHHYWTTNDLGYAGPQASCTVTPTPNCGVNTPMRVCVDGVNHGSVTDPSGNVCNWTQCGDGKTSNLHFGGCAGNTTAGTLCCPYIIL